MAFLSGLVIAIALVLLWSARNANTPINFTFVTTWERRRTQILRQAGVYGVTGWQLLILQFVAGLLAGLVVVVISRSLSVTACFIVFAFLAPTALVRSMRRRRQQELRQVWPEVVDNLSSAVRAGLSLPEAVGALATRGPQSLQPAFTRFTADYRLSGRFSECLDRLKADLADPVGDRVCESLRLAREVGGTELGRLLRTLSAFLREEARTRAELETRQGWTVNAARLAVAAPWAVLLLLATQSTTLEAYDSFVGRLLLAFGALISMGAYRIMRRIGRLPEERRVMQ